VISAGRQGALGGVRCGEGVTDDDGTVRAGDAALLGCPAVVSVSSATSIRGNCRIGVWFTAMRILDINTSDVVDDSGSGLTTRTCDVSEECYRCGWAVNSGALILRVVVGVCA